MNTGHSAEAARRRRQLTRPYLNVYSLCLELAPLPGQLPGNTTASIVHLDRQGVDPASRSVHLCEVSGQFQMHSLEFAEPQAQSVLSRQRAQLVLGNVQTTAVLQPTAEPDTPFQTVSKRRRKRLVERADRARIRVVER